MNIRRLPLSAAALVLAAAPLSACGGESAESSAGGTPTAAVTKPKAVLSITDPWVKAADSGMSAAFGTLVNNTDQPVTIVSGTSPASPMIELHEVVTKDGESVMQAKQGGFVIPAHGSHRLTPGGDHIMLMDVKQKVRPGDEVAFTLKLGDGGTFSFTAVAKEYSGAKESYHPEHHG